MTNSKQARCNLTNFHEKYKENYTSDVAYQHSLDNKQPSTQTIYLAPQKCFNQFLLAIKPLDLTIISNTSNRMLLNDLLCTWTDQGPSTFLRAINSLLFDFEFEHPGRRRPNILQLPYSPSLERLQEFYNTNKNSTQINKKRGRELAKQFNNAFSTALPPNEKQNINFILTLLQKKSFHDFLTALSLDINKDANYENYLLPENVLRQHNNLFLNDLRQDTSPNILRVNSVTPSATDPLSYIMRVNSVTPSVTSSLSTWKKFLMFTGFRHTKEFACFLAIMTVGALIGVSLVVFWPATVGALLTGGLYVLGAKALSALVMGASGAWAAERFTRLCFNLSHSMKKQFSIHEDRPFIGKILMGAFTAMLETARSFVTQLFFLSIIGPALYYSCRPCCASNDEKKREGSYYHSTLKKLSTSSNNPNRGEDNRIRLPKPSHYDQNPTVLLNPPLLKKKMSTIEEGSHSKIDISDSGSGSEPNSGQTPHQYV